MAIGQAISAATEQVKTLYENPEQRPELVSTTLTKIGAEKVLSAKAIERVAALSTRAGREEEKAALKEAVEPYTKMSKDDLVAEVKPYVEPYVAKVSPYVEPIVTKATPYVEPIIEKATPYVEAAVEKVSVSGSAVKEVVVTKGSEVKEVVVAKKDAVKEVVAPYIQTAVAKKDAVLQDERVQKALAELSEKLAAVRERPADVALELKNTAVDLIKYDKVTEYREYVCSEQFVADTTKLVKEDLPALAKDAAAKGSEAVQAAATTLRSELSAASAIVADAWKKGREEQPDLRSWEALRGLAQVLVTELQAGVAERFGEHQLAAKYAEAILRIKIVFGLAEPKPLLEEAPAPEEEPEATGAAATDEPASAEGSKTVAAVRSASRGVIRGASMMLMLGVSSL